MECFGNKNPQLHKAGGTLCDTLTEQTAKNKTSENILDFICPFNK